MSLLLEALKKAELAKQNASGQAGEGAAAPAEPPASLSLDLTPGGPGERTPMMTRDRLPDITQPLEILSEDLPSAGARREAPSHSAAPIPSPGMGAASPASAAEDEERAAARQMFEAKTPDYDPRRPFFIVVGVLGVGILGALGYFAFEVFAPRPAFYAGPAGGKPTQTAAAPVTPQQPPAQTQATGTPVPAAPSEPAPTAGAAPDTSASPAAVPVPPQPTPSGVTPTGRPGASRSSVAQASGIQAGPRRLAVPAEPAEAGAAQPARVPIRVTANSPRVDPALESAWQALQAGDLAAAKEGYLRVVRANPNSRDALLGLATVDARTQDYEGAEARYLRVLELDPRDVYAQAGMIALRGQTNPSQSESRIKNMLAQQPDASFLNFSLGNLYASQARWSDAQAAYFKAFSSDPDNLDYAYNLAVSLDHLRQEKLALEYYRRALALAGNRAVGFNSAQVEARIRELTR